MVMKGCDVMISPDKKTSMLLDVQYVKPNKNLGLPDYLYIIWRDTETGEKHMKAIPEPTMTIYFEKPQYRNHDYNLNHAPLKHLEPRNVKFTNIIKAIAEDAGENGKKYLENAYQRRDYEAIRRMHLYPYVFGADYDVATWYRIQWLRQFNKDVPKILRKGFMDIEVDGVEVPGMVSAEDCPINAITLIDDWAKVSYTFLLINRKCTDPRKLELYQHMWDEQKWVMDNQDKVNSMFHEVFDTNYGKLDYKFYFYEDEAMMLTHFFELVHRLKLDFIGIWNMSFDIPYLIDRMVALGLDARKVMSHPDFPSPKCRFKPDNINHEIKKKTDALLLTSYTTFFCQMELFGGLRKTKSEYQSYRLNYIAQRELNDTKLDYSEETNIKLLPYKNFLKFIMYNVKDVLLQVKLERKNGDFDNLYANSFLNATPYDKSFRQTVKLRNAQYYYYLDDGIVPGANVNIFNEEPEEYHDKDDDDEDEDDDDDETIEGALVADPQFNDNVGIEIFGRPSNCVFRYSIDEDMTAFYPSSIMGANIDASTLIMKVSMEAKQFDSCGGDMKLRGITRDSFAPDDDCAKECFDNFQTGNHITTAWKWLGLPSIADAHKYISERMK